VSAPAPPPPRAARVLVVDDSAFARKVLREVLSRAPDLEVVGIARDGLEALEKIAELKPDVVTLDLVMPGLDGLGVLRELPAVGAPRVVVVSISDEQSELVVEALQLGAVDFVRKPTSLATDRLYELGAELARKVGAAAAARAGERRPAAAAPPPPLAVKTELVVVGTSTGGPQALTTFLSALPANFPCALAVALHIPADYTPALARRLDEASAIEVREASEGLELRPGRAVLARGGVHLEIVRRAAVLTAHLTSIPVTVYYPSVDVLLSSAARACGSGALGVVLTGMGEDGLAGARALVDRGGRVLTEAESTCVVYGMPRSIAEAGLSAGAVPLDEMAAAVMRAL
jgi:two-component system, chemotaxis family, protein-glutamate methylesterase/glutaminase